MYAIGLLLMGIYKGNLQYMSSYVVLVGKDRNKSQQLLAVQEHSL